MNLGEIKYLYFIGVGGIGMSALARYFNSIGKEVFGYDRNQSPLALELINEGIQIHFEDSTQNIPKEIKENRESTLVVFTPAIPKDHKEFAFLNHSEYTIVKRAEVLGIISNQGNCIAVAGTHGKTTTSSIIAQLLHHSDQGCNAFIGGITSNFNSNLVLQSDSKNYVVEADEFDRSFLALHPTVAIITSMDADHLDIYGEEKELIKSFQLFADQIVDGGKLIIKKEISTKIISRSDIRTYSIVDSSADYFGENIEVKEGKYSFSLRHPEGKMENLTLGLAGRHNIENATAALACCLELGVSKEVLTSALKNYSGVKRRFEYIYSDEKITYIDDYAHHPEELKVTILSAKELFPNKKITGIFQPHLFSRTKDFADEFAEALSILDEIILLPIYPAREKPMPGVDSQLILNKIGKADKKLVEKNVLLYELKSNLPEVLLTLGAGDIDALVNPIKELISK